MAALMLLVTTIIIIIINVIAAPVSAASESKNGGFQAVIQRFFDGHLTKTELIQIAAKQGKQRVMKIMVDSFPGVETESSSHGDRLIIKTHIQQLSLAGFFMNFSIGTPAQPFSAFIDTGSDPIWTQCKPCKHCVNQSTPIFDPRKSSSYYKVNCNSRMCKEFPFHDQPICGKHGECTYKFMYLDNTSTQGVLATETFTFEGNVSVPNLEFGCGFNNEGDAFGPIPATIGLGRGKTSLVSQMKDSNFSYCLPTYYTNETGVLSVGSIPTTLRHAKTTPLVKNPFVPTLYYLSLQGISVGETWLNIDKTKLEINTTDGTGGLLIDSGATLTYLEKSVFGQVTKELTNQLKLPLYTTETGLELCYIITRPVEKIAFPNITFHFQGADFQVIKDNYLLLITHVKMKTKAGGHNRGTIGCLIMGSSPYPGGLSVFGNFQQQNALVGYDLVENKLSFITNTNCATAN